MGMLLHYKFDIVFLERCQEAVAGGHYWDGAAEYRAYLEALESNPNFALTGSQ
jgi:hypothetical protein